ncbi:MAG TPA: YutD family protein [Mollicutes bacterium]|nr:YutD family protein [Mollicutes bacterium]
MEKVVTINNQTYKIIENYKDGYNEEELKSKLTDYFYDYDYILGDWAYGKLRLKGFYDPKNKKAKDLNNYKYIQKYIKNYCAYECKYFIAKRVYKN